MYPKLQVFQPSLITTTWFQDYLKEPQEINQGLCWEWAWMAHKMFKGVELWDICEHAFVRHGNKFYDSERLLGEADWEDLPAANFGVSGELCPECLKGSRDDGNVVASPLTETQFKCHWNSQTKRFHTTWTKLDRLVQKELRRHVRR